MALLCFPPAAVKTKQMSPQNKRRHTTLISFLIASTLLEAAGGALKYLH